MISTTDWPAADRAYQLHHANCPTCRAAGAAPGSVQRCTVGAQLWATYLKRAFCTAVVKNPRTLCVSAGALLHQRPIRVDLTPQ